MRTKKVWGKLKKTTILFIVLQLVLMVPFKAAWATPFTDINTARSSGQTDPITIIDTTPPISSVNTLSQYINTDNFNIDITSDDSGRGVEYVELWYRKDGVGDYTSYCDRAISRQDPEAIFLTRCSFVANPINFNTFLVGGDGFYEFYSIAVDNAGNREEAPGGGSLTLEELQASGISRGAVPDASTTVDTAKPVITLNGSSPMTITVGGTFTDPGATADDGTVVVVSGSVNTGVVGAYTIHYNATDLAGNPATEVTRTVNVVAAPAGSPFSATSNPLSEFIPTAGATGASTGEVLGTTTTTNKNNNQTGNTGGGVQGSQDENKTDQTDNNKVGSFFTKKILGIYWWIWLMLILFICGYFYWKTKKEN